MKKFACLFVMAAFITFSAFTAKGVTSWKVKDGAYTVKFSGGHLMGKMSGTFKGLKATIIFDEDNLPASKISASIDAATVNTGNDTKSHHAQEGLGAEEYPVIKFESASIVKKGNAYEATGSLTLKNVTKQIVMPFTFDKQGAGGTFNGKFSLKTADYNITKSGTPDEVEIELTVPVTK